jgi:hypothetical protein
LGVHMQWSELMKITLHMQWWSIFGKEVSPLSTHNNYMSYEAVQCS